MSFVFAQLDEFQNGDLLPTGLVNATLAQIDSAQGLDNALIMPCESGALQSTCGVWHRPLNGWVQGRQVEYWLAHNGDRLVVYNGGDDLTNITFNADSDHEQTFGAQPGVESVFALDTSGLYRYQPVKIRFFNAYDRLFIRYAYQTDSNAPSLGALPSFSQGDVSSAADLNTILRAGRNAITNMNQPVAGQVYWSKRVGSFNHYYGWIKHRHGRFVADMTITTSGIANPPDAAFWSYNGVTVWSREFPADGVNAFDGQINVPVPAGLVEGQWYEVHFGYNRTGENEQHVKLWWFGEAPDSNTAGTGPRWQHGDWVHGNAGSPQLHSLSVALEELRPHVRWVNPACRQAASFIPAQCGGDEEVDSFWSFRRHRWLAYEPFVMADGKRATATVQWMTGPRTLQSVTLPAIDRPGFYDLDSTPVREGMYMQISGVKFALQTPDAGGNYV